MNMKKEMVPVLNYALKKGFQINPQALELLGSLEIKASERIIKDLVMEKTKQKIFQINQDDLETYLGIKEDPTLENEVEVLSEPTAKITTGEGVEGYNALFSSRFRKLREIVADRPESKMIKTIASVKNAKTDDSMYVCGLVNKIKVERSATKIEMEDSTGVFEGAVFDSELQKIAGTLLVDQFIILKITLGKKLAFAINDVIFPDIPQQEKNRSGSEVYAAFLSDLHIGSKYFMEEEFLRFVSWMSSPDPIARKVRFVLIAGDVVDGVGIYPNQDKELVCQTIEQQLQRAEELIDKIPKNVKIVIMPGNHDPGRRALPQPAIPKKYNSGLWERDNVFMVGNPAVVSLNGVRVTMFHGQSIDDVVKTTPGLSYDKPADVMKHLLKARHLNPIYGNRTPTAPEIEDLLIIEEVPDIFHVGHVHRAQIANYKGVLLINSGSWQKQTPFQASVGMTPNPGIAIMVNLKTGKPVYENYNAALENVL